MESNVHEDFTITKKALVGAVSVIVKLPTSRRYVSSSRAKLRSRSPDPSSPRQQRQQGAVAAGKILAVVPWPSLAPHHTCPRVNLRSSGNTPPNILVASQYCNIAYFQYWF